MRVVDHETVDASVRKKLKQPRGSYKAYSDKDRFLIGKDASIYGPSSAARKWKKTYPNLNESKLPALDPFSDICPLMKVAPPMETLRFASLFPQELDSYRWRVDDASDDVSEWEYDDDTTVCDNDDVTGTDGEVSNADDDGARNVPDLFDLFE